MQYWRIINIEAVFKTDVHLEHIFYSHLFASITSLTNILKPIIPDLDFDNVTGERERIELTRLTSLARSLSFNLQRGFVSCQVVVTAHSSDEKDDMELFGTYSFGLEKITTTDQKVLMKVKSTT